MDLKIEYVPLSDLKPYKNNARKHGKEDISAIERSIQEFGFDDPIGVWHDVIVEGHGRLLAAVNLGMDKVPIIRLDHLTDEQRRAYALAHNKTAELSSWNIDLMASELQEINDIDMSVFGFDPIAEKDVVDDNFVLNPPKDPVSKRGDIWMLGAHRVMCGDATDHNDVEKLCCGHLVDLYITDPPYNVDYTGKTKDALKIQNDKQEDDVFRAFLSDSFLNAKMCMKGGGGVLYLARRFRRI